jgi:hypothetical protein
MKLLSKRLPGALIVLATAASIHTPAFAMNHATAQPAATLDQNASAFAESSVRAITGTWNAREMMKRAAPEIMTPFVRQELPNSYARLNAKLGKLKSLGAPMSDNAPPTPGSAPDQHPAPAVSSAPHDGQIEHYVFNAVFTTGGPARVEIVLRYRKKWQIVGLHVDSPLLPQ